MQFHSAELWSARVGYEWTGTHNPGCVTDPRANNRLFGDVTITPVSWLTIGKDADMILHRSWQSGFRRSSAGSGIRRFWANGRQTFPYKIRVELPVTRAQSHLPRGSASPPNHYRSYSFKSQPSQMLNPKKMQERLLVAVILFCGLAAAQTSYQNRVAIFPRATWAKAAPEQLGWATTKRYEARRFFETLPPASLFVVDHGNVVAEWGDSAM